MADENDSENRQISMVRFLFLYLKKEKSSKLTIISSRSGQFIGSVSLHL